MKSLVVFLAAVLAVSYAEIDPAHYTVTDEVWFEVEVKDMDGPGQDYTGRFTVAVFGQTAPMTSLNFVSIAKGYKKGRTMLHYKNTPIHRIVPDFVIQMGDITIGDGTGGKSIFGDKFDDEQFVLSHRSPGWVAMANHGKDTNGSQFYILLTKARWLDQKHVVFGKVIKGMDVVKAVGEVPADRINAKPKKRVKITDCGVNTLQTRYELREDQLDLETDL